jgi:DNA-binding transcriptional ArsR family regulator
LLKALAHPARIAIVEHLLKVNSCICGDIVHELPLAQPTVSQHLKELKNAGIIKGAIDGNNLCYCLDQKSINKLSEYLVSISNKLKENINCC